MQGLKTERKIKREITLTIFFAKYMCGNGQSQKTNISKRSQEFTYYLCLTCTVSFWLPSFCIQNLLFIQRSWQPRTYFFNNYTVLFLMNLHSPVLCKEYSQYYFPFNSWLSFQWLCRLLWGHNISQTTNILPWTHMLESMSIFMFLCRYCYLLAIESKLTQHLANASSAKSKPTDFKCSLSASQTHHYCWNQCKTEVILNLLMCSVYRLDSTRISASVGGSLQSGMNTTNESGSCDSASRLCMQNNASLTAQHLLLLH